LKSTPILGKTWGDPVDKLISNTDLTQFLSHSRLLGPDYFGREFDIN
jgi:hypothetical protein